MQKCFVKILFFISISSIFALDLPISQISDDSLLRTGLRDSHFIESPNRVLGRRPEIHQLPTGERVEVRIEEGRTEFVILFARELVRGRVATETAAAQPRRGTGQFPGWAQGSWMLRRDRRTGNGTLIRVFLRSDQNTYIQFTPFTNERCQMDVVLYGGYIVRNLPIPVPFERLYTMQLNDVLNLAGDKFPRRYFEIDPIYYRDNRRFVTQVRSHIGGLRYADDGAIDENGRYVFINTLREQPAATRGLNCSGFVKWLIDGSLRPVTGERLRIEPLKQPAGNRGSSFTEQWEALRDPYFGLDWNRNLAIAANTVLRSPAYGRIEEFEVRVNNFASVIVSENRTFVTHSYPGFLTDAGYGIEGLLPLLYTLAVDDPFKFYLAAVNDERSGPGPNPRVALVLRQFFHTAALIPYFDEYGNFRVTVFESAAETSFPAFRNRYPRGHYVNLAAVPVPAQFSP